MKKNFEQLDLLAKLEAKRAELDKEIEELKTELTALKTHLEHVVVDLPHPDSKEWEMLVVNLPFRFVDGQWEPAFKIVPK